MLTTTLEPSPKAPPEPPLSVPRINWSTLRFDLQITRARYAFAWTELYDNSPTRPTRSYVARRLGVPVEEVQLRSRRTAPGVSPKFPSMKSLSTQSGRKRSGRKTESGKIDLAVGWQVWVRLTPTGKTPTPHQETQIAKMREREHIKGQARRLEVAQWRRRMFDTADQEWEADAYRNMTLTQRAVVDKRRELDRRRAKLAEIREAERAGAEEQLLADWDAAIEWDRKRTIAIGGYLRSKEIAPIVGRNRTMPGGVDYAPQANRSGGKS